MANTDEKTKNNEPVRYRTVLGIETENLVPARLIDVGYAFAFLATWYYTLHGVESIIGPQESFILLVILASALTFLPLAIKLSLFGQESFPPRMIVITLAASTLPMLFAFFGMDTATSGKHALAEEKGAALEVVGTFNVATRRKVGDAIGAIERERDKEIGEIDTELVSDLALYERRKVNVRHTAIDEREGVPGAGLTGQAGDNTFARARAAESRRENEMFEVNKKEAEAAAKTKRDAIRAEADGRIAHLREALATLDRLVPTETAPAERDVETVTTEIVPPAAEQIAKAGSFGALAQAANRSNSLMAQAASHARAGVQDLQVEVRDVTVSSDDIFEMSVRGLQEGKISTWMSLAIAMFMEWLDSFIAFFVRSYQERKKEKRLVDRIDELEKENAELQAQVDDLGGSSAKLPTPVSPSRRPVP